MYIYIYIYLLMCFRTYRLTHIDMRQTLPSGGEESKQLLFTLARGAPGELLPQVEVADPMGWSPCKVSLTN